MKWGRGRRGRGLRLETVDTEVPSQRLSVATRRQNDGCWFWNGITNNYMPCGCPHSVHACKWMQHRGGLLQLRRYFTHVSWTVERNISYFYLFLFFFCFFPRSPNQIWNDLTRANMRQLRCSPHTPSIFVVRSTWLTEPLENISILRRCLVSNEL